MVLYGDGVVFFFPFQENEKSPSQNRKAKDATSDNGKGEAIFLLLVALATAFIPN